MPSMIVSFMHGDLIFNSFVCLNLIKQIICTGSKDAMEKSIQRLTLPASRQAVQQHSPQDESKVLTEDPPNDTTEEDGGSSPDVPATVTAGCAPTKQKLCDIDKKSNGKRKKPVMATGKEDFEDPFDAVGDSSNTSSILMFYALEVITTVQCLFVGQGGLEQPLLSDTQFLGSYKQLTKGLIVHVQMCVCSCNIVLYRVLFTHAHTHRHTPVFVN